MKALIASTAVVLAACAGPQPTYWYKTGATERDFNMAMARCRMGIANIPESRKGGPGADLQDIATRMQYGDDCLIADGWYRGPRP